MSTKSIEPPADLSAFGKARAIIQGAPLEAEELRKMDAYWRASLYLSLGMIYLRDNPLLEQPLKVEHTKVRLLGHWGSDPGMSLIYIHLNRLIKKYELDAIFLAGPGHGAPAILSNTYLEGTYSEIYPDKSQNRDGLKKFFTQFSFPGGIGSHFTPETPGSIHEGGELGYSLSHAYGTVSEYFPEDADGGELSVDGRVMEMLSEHTLEGWLEGYLLTGRHGFFSTYESFVHVIDSMVNEHCKWLEISEHPHGLPDRDFDSLSSIFMPTRG